MTCLAFHYNSFCTGLLVSDLKHYMKFLLGMVGAADMGAYTEKYT